MSIRHEKQNGVEFAIQAPTAPGMVRTALIECNYEGPILLYMLGDGSITDPRNETPSGLYQSNQLRMRVGEDNMVGCDDSAVLNGQQVRALIHALQRILETNPRLANG